MTPLFSILWVYAPALLLLGVIATLHQLYAIPFGFFFRDPTVTLQGHPLTGISSNIGAIIWLSTGGICIFSSQLIHHYLSTLGTSQMSLFLGCSGLLTLTLAVDDFFFYTILCCLIFLASMKKLSCSSIPLAVSPVV